MEHSTRKNNFNSGLGYAKIPHLHYLRNTRAFPLLPAALASVPFGFVL
jgi:hypothetical protein